MANELGKLIADFTGRGAERSRAFMHQDVVVCLFEDTASSAEKNLVASGRSHLVRLTRTALQDAMAPQLIVAIERLTNRTVRSFLSGSNASGGSAIESFGLESIATALARA